MGVVLLELHWKNHPLKVIRKLSLNASLWSVFVVLTVASCSIASWIAYHIPAPENLQQFIGKFCDRSSDRRCSNNSATLDEGWLRWELFKCKVFILPLPEYMNVELYDAFRRFLPQNPAMEEYGQEFFLHQYLLQSDMITTNADEADVFFVPFYASLTTVLAADFGQEEYFSPIREQKLLETLGAMPHFLKHGGSDFAFPLGHPNVLWYFRPNYTSVMKMLPDAFSWQAGSVDWSRDLVLPYCNTGPDWFIFKELRPPQPERDIFIFFFGRENNNWRNTRTRLRIELQGHPNVSYNDPALATEAQDHDKYIQLLRRSVFCLSPQGHFAATARTFELIVAECIPVIIADLLELPFDSYLDWSQFAVLVPGNVPGAALVDTLLNMPPEEIRSKQRVLSRIWPYFTAHTKFSQQPSFAQLAVSEMCERSCENRRRSRRHRRLEEYKAERDRHPRLTGYEDWNNPVDRERVDP